MTTIETHHLNQPNNHRNSPLKPTQPPSKPTQPQLKPTQQPPKPTTNPNLATIDQPNQKFHLRKREKRETKWIVREKGEREREREREKSKKIKNFKFPNLEQWALALGSVKPL